MLSCALSTGRKSVSMKKSLDQRIAARSKELTFEKSPEGHKTGELPESIDLKASLKVGSLNESERPVDIEKF